MGRRSGQSERVFGAAYVVIPLTIESQGSWREAFAPATGSRIWGGCPHGRKAPIPRKGLIEILDKSLENQAPRVDERLAKVVQIIVEQYDGDVKAFVESTRYRIEGESKG